MFFRGFCSDAPGALPPFFFSSGSDRRNEGEALVWTHVFHEWMVKMVQVNTFLQFVII